MAAIQPVTVQPVGDDQQWKRDMQRAVEQLIRELAAAQTKIGYLEGRVR